VNHKISPSPIRELFYEARAELSKDADNLQFREDEESIDAAIVCLFCRITTHLRALEALYQNELALEADVLLRGCLESVFWMGSLINQPDTVKDMENQFNYQRQNMARNLLAADPTIVNLDTETRNRMEVVQAEKKIKRNDLISVFDVARRAEVAAMYLPFSELSNSAAHASLHSLNRHLVVKEDKSIDYFTVLVTDANWNKVFHLGCCIIFFTKNFLNKRFNSPGRDWENGLWERLQKVNQIEEP